jgi:hypothetical protein
VGSELLHVDGQTYRRTESRTDMTNLIAAFRNFENAPKTNKKCKLQLTYNYSIIKNFSSKTLPSSYPTQGSLGQIRPTHYFLKKKKHRKTIIILPRLACILVPKNCPTEKVFKKSNSVTKRLNKPPIHKYLKLNCSAEL